MTCRVGVFASGGGTTLQALMDHAKGAARDWEVVLVVSDRPGVGALSRARDVGVATSVVPVSGRDPGDVAAQVLEGLAERGIDLVVLAGYLRLIPQPVVEAFEGRMLNIHPALLPSFGGRGMYGDNVHRAVLASGARVTGPTVHLVNAEYDRGLPLAQWPVPVLPGDSLTDLKDRVQRVERALYPLVVDHVVGDLSRGLSPSPLTLAHPAFGAEPGRTDSELRSIIQKSISWPTPPDGL